MKIFATASLFVISLFLLILAPILTESSMGRGTSDSGSTLTGIQSIYIFVEPLAAEVENKGITHEVLAAEVERRVRAAGISVTSFESGDSVPGIPTLYLQVNALAEEYIEQCTYSIRLELTQAVHLERNPSLTPFHAPTWGTGGVGIQLESWRQALIDDVLHYVDEFVDAYYLANPARDE